MKDSSWMQICPVGAKDKYLELEESNLSPNFFCDDKRHLVCVPYTVGCLHEMAESLGIDRCWFHRSRKTGLAHYDIPKRRFQEIRSRCHNVPSSLIALIARGMLNDFYFSLGRWNSPASGKHLGKGNTSTSESSGFPPKSERQLPERLQPASRPKEPIFVG